MPCWVFLMLKVTFSGAQYLVFEYLFNLTLSHLSNSHNLSALNPAAFPLSLILLLYRYVYHMVFHLKIILFFHIPHTFVCFILDIFLLLYCQLRLNPPNTSFLCLLFQHIHPSFHLHVFHELRRVQFKKRFSAQFVQFSDKFGSLNVQIRNNFKNIIFIACK